LARLRTACNFALSIAGLVLPGSAAASSTVDVSTPPECYTGVQSADSWIHLDSWPVFPGSATVPFSIDASDGTPRTGSFEVSTARLPGVDIMKSVTISQGGSLPSLVADRSQLRFGAVNNASALTSATETQTVSLSQVGAGSVAWTVESDAPWLVVDPASGSGSGQFTASLVNLAGILPASGSASASITITPAGAGGAPIVLPVTVMVYVPGNSAAGHSTAPFGTVDTPANNTSATAYQGAIGVTGWALDDIEVASVKIYRDPVSIDPAGAIGPNGKVYVGDATFIPGARPDVEGIYTTTPLNYRAGWGLLVLTNMLPDTTAGTSAGGRGRFVLHADAFDAEGRNVRLGSRTIYVNNSALTAPFGTLDTPAQGGTASGGAFANFGWTLAPLGRTINASSLLAWVDGAPIGQPGYGYCRAAVVNGACTDDIATLFPTYANKDGAIGALVFSTLGMANGLHTIAWSVSDSAGQGQGLGSRFFTVFNASTDAPLDATRPTAAAPALGRSLASLPRASGVATLSAATGYAGSPALAAVASGVARVGELDRLVARVDAAESQGWTAYQQVRGTLRGLPVGASFDPSSRTLSWQLGPGFVGRYDFAFVRHEGAEAVDTVPLQVVVGTVPEVTPGLAGEGAASAERPDAAVAASPTSTATGQADATPTTSAEPVAPAHASTGQATSQPSTSDVAPPDARAVGAWTYAGRAPSDPVPARQAPPTAVTVTLNASVLLGAPISGVRWSVPSGDLEGLSATLSLDPGDHVVTVTGVRAGMPVSEILTVHVEASAADGAPACAVTRASAPGDDVTVRCGVR
jgi:hypothetical protein